MVFSNIIFTVFLLAIVLVDVRSRLIPNNLLLIAIIVTIVTLPIINSMDSLVSGLFGGFIGFGLFGILFLLAPAKVGAGDVKLAGLIGFMVGFPMVFLALLLTGLIGGLVIMALVALKRGKVLGSIPFAPFLCSGAIISLWAGSWIINWYWGLF